MCLAESVRQGAWADEEDGGHHPTDSGGMERLLQTEKHVQEQLQLELEVMKLSEAEFAEGISALAWAADKKGMIL
jgi:hypothetical protein